MRQVPHGDVQSVLEAAESRQGKGLSRVISRAAFQESLGSSHGAELQDCEEARLHRWAGGVVIPVMQTQFRGSSRSGLGLS